MAADLAAGRQRLGAPGFTQIDLHLGDQANVITNAAGGFAGCEDVHFTPAYPFTLRMTATAFLDGGLDATAGSPPLVCTVPSSGSFAASLVSRRDDREEGSLAPRRRSACETGTFVPTVDRYTILSKQL